MRVFIVLQMVLISVLCQAQIEVRFDGEFTESQKARLKEATKAAYYGLFYDGAVNNCLIRTGASENLDLEAYKKAYGSTPDWIYARNTSVWALQRDTFRKAAMYRKPLPHLTFKAFHYDNPTYSFVAYRGVVTTKALPDFYGNYTIPQIEGNFEVTVNTNSNFFGDAFNAPTRAGFVAHEMLHNLLHTHPDSVYGKATHEEANSTKYGMNALENCIATQGKGPVDKTGKPVFGGIIPPVPIHRNW